MGFGGYGGLIDQNGVIWSSNPMLRWDTSKPLTGANGMNWTRVQPSELRPLYRQSAATFRTPRLVTGSDS